MSAGVISLQAPLREADVRALRVGDQVLCSGVLHTARDAAHKYLAARSASELPAGLSFAGGMLYHCGPVMIRRQEGGWRVTAAGPTTSAREEAYEAEVIRRYGVRAIIGKGGMGKKTLSACQECGCVYLSAVGGAAQVLAQAVEAVEAVYFEEEFGSPEAIWQLRVRDFPAIVTMDSHGNNLHAQVDAASSERWRQLVHIPI